MRRKIRSIFHMHKLIESGDNPDIEYQMHPIIDKEWFLSDKVLIAEDPDIPLPVAGSGDGTMPLRVFISI
ncbi:clathrin adaptor complexes medium subunit family protein [Artemisia annua]|uniref:Clathrin adaptor complexes medium subunit family protein n=1 Tax=Artemisia annua TaxID=35608 RepID=A0A2U1NVJ7_ARTAN|nr:clathrin adaptor complexes medium subunit family protein [Artemisia annua]